MRLHHLEITAFGPFPDHVEVDFDQLSDAGLFLLSGATGSGKTSVLDAVCFALYGDVPGDRASAKRLRCDQADPSVAPRVTLDCTLAGRRFRIVRSPAWRRPKKRGTGTTPQQASVTLTERIEGEWVARSSRLDEAGHLISDLLGMNQSQFVQVAMLPQGQFQTFLRAKSEDRQRLLQRLFATDRFERVERWLKDRRAALKRASARHHDLVAGVVSRISEAAGTPVPAEWDLHDLEAPSREGELGSWTSAVRREAAAAAAGAAAAAKARDSEHAAARDALAAGHRLSDLKERHRRAAAEHDRLVARDGQHRANLARRDGARRAAAIVPLREAARTAKARAAAAGRAWDRAHSEAAVLLGSDPGSGDLIEESLADARDAAVRLGARAGALLPREVDLARHRADADRLQAELDSLVHAADARAERRRALPQLLAAATAARDDTARAAEQVPALVEAVERCRVAAEAAAQVISLAAELGSAKEDLNASVEHHLGLREQLVQLREERILGMAGELAEALAVGDSCPVCGSGDHPHPAVRRTGAPGAEAERRARKAVDDAESDRQAREEHVRDSRTRLRLAEERCGGRTLEECETARRGAESELAQARALTAEHHARCAEVERLAAELGRLDSEHEQAEVDRARLSTARESALDGASKIEGELTELLDRHDAADLSDLADLCALRVRACDRALEAHRAHTEARRASDEAGDRAVKAAAEAGFPDLAQALAAALPRAELEALESRIAAHEASLRAAESALADAELREAAELPVPDVPGLTESAVVAERAHTAASAAADRTRTTSERLDQLTVELSRAEADWLPVREELDLVSRVTALVDGSSADNALRMRLSAYVLAYRLSQVVAAANERLVGMSDRRYSLEHTAQRGARETRGGLGLLVRDDWSGEARDPATLSGGETFVVSLALALGLADVISEEAGGADLDTLFVDEGFGSLDAEILDDVMDTLDSLREGGRVVGVVSHVAEMRDRITTRLQVSKHRTGSTLTVLTGP